MVQPDLDHSQNKGPIDPDIDPDVRPVDQHATLPNTNMIGWSRAEKLALEQVSALQDANITTEKISCINIGNIPVNQELMLEAF